MTKSWKYDDKITPRGTVSWDYGEESGIVGLNFSDEEKAYKGGASSPAREYRMTFQRSKAMAIRDALNDWFQNHDVKCDEATSFNNYQAWVKWADENGVILHSWETARAINRGELPPRRFNASGPAKGSEEGRSDVGDRPAP